MDGALGWNIYLHPSFLAFGPLNSNKLNNVICETEGDTAS